MSTQIRLLSGIAILLIQNGCALSSSSQPNISITVPDLSTSHTFGLRSLANASFLLPSSPGTLAFNQVGSLPAPLAVGDFTCLGVMVTGPGIGPNGALLSGCGNGSNGPGFIPGPGMPSQPGVLGGLVPITGGSLDVAVPSGPGRLIQIFGIQSAMNPTCKPVSQIISEKNNNNGGSNNLGDPIELGRTTSDVFADVSLSLNVAFNPVAPKPIFSCGGGSNGGGAPVIFPPQRVAGLQVWLNPETLTGATDNSSLTTWYDSSGKSNNFTQLSSPAQPKVCLSSICTTGGTPLPNGKPVLHFATSLFMSSNSGIAALTSNTRTVLLVGQSQAGAYQTFFSESFATGAAGLSSDLLHIRYNAGGTFLGSSATNVGGSIGNTNGSGQIIGSTAAYHVFSLVWRGTGNVDFGVDGSFSASAPGANATPVTHLGEFLGSSGAGTYFLNGEIAEVIVYDHEIGDPDRSMLECYLQGKFGTPVLGHACP